jgi:mannose-6-phosphate isomerase
MTISPFHPLRFEPIYQYRLWGGRRLASWLAAPLPGDGPIGEAWLLSDRDDHPSRVAEGPFKGRTITQLIEQSAEHILGRLSPRFSRFPLLLKFLDVSGMLSVQVHPSDTKGELIPRGETGKTEAWVVLEAEPGSRVYAGLKSGTTSADLRALSKETVNDCLASFSPSRGQGLLIEAGVVHALGDGVVVFEVQENSDVTFRLYDWDHVDPHTGHRRALQVEHALECVDFAQGAIVPIEEVIQPAIGEQLFDCSHFQLWRIRSAARFTVGAPDVPRVLVCIDGIGHIEYAGSDYAMAKGAVVLMPAVIGACSFRPKGSVTMLEIAVPEIP